MAIQTKTTLKSFFQTGDIPTEQNYADFIDSTLNLGSNNIGNLEITGDITASGNISSSGNLDVTGNVNIDGNLDVDGITNLDVVDIDGAVNMASSLEVIGNITASGGISASGIRALTFTSPDGGQMTSDPNSDNFFFSRGGTFSSHITSSGNISSSFTSTGSFGRLESHTIGGLSPITITDDTTVLGNITGSNIVASGKLIGNTLSLGGVAITATGTEINHLDGVTANEMSQVKNINSTSITSAQWVYVGNLNQNLNTGSEVQFASIGLSKLGLSEGDFGGIIEAEGKSFRMNIINVPAINPLAEQEIKSTEPTTVTNDQCDQSTVIIATCSTHDLVVNCFNASDGSFKFSVSNTSTTPFDGGTITVNFVLI